jgi:hypothetical protein
MIDSVQADPDAIKPDFQWILKALSPRIKRSEREPIINLI